MSLLSFLVRAVFGRRAARAVRALERASRRRRRRPAPAGVGAEIAGRAWVEDADGLIVAGHRIRLAHLDAPESRQPARARDGRRFDHGKRVKRDLIRAVGGKAVRVEVLGGDRYGRVVGRVWCEGRDIGAWLVRSGRAIAAYGEDYRELEREACEAGRGLWGLQEAYDPRDWRRRGRSRAP